VVLENAGPTMLPEVAAVLTALGAAVVLIGWRKRVPARSG
jgi:hypothetical protein